MIWLKTVFVKSAFKLPLITLKSNIAGNKGKKMNFLTGNAYSNNADFHTMRT